MVIKIGDIFKGKIAISQYINVKIGKKTLATIDDKSRALYSTNNPIKLLWIMRGLISIEQVTNIYDTDLAYTIYSSMSYHKGKFNSKYKCAKCINMITNHKTRLLCDKCASKGVVKWH